MHQSGEDDIRQRFQEDQNEFQKAEQEKKEKTMR